MAHTNQTTNYHMSQFLGTDKPAWLTDYNADMSTIDGQMKTNADNIVVANTLAQTAKTTADEAQEDATDALADAASAQQTANTAVASAQTANQAIQALKEYFAFTDTGEANIPAFAGLSISGILRYALNSDRSAGKIYANDLNLSVTSSLGSITVPLGVSVKATGVAYTIYGPRAIVKNAQGEISIKSPALQIASNGAVSLTINANIANANYAIFLPPCIYFFEDFGD